VPYLWMLFGSFFFAVMGLLIESLGTEYSFAWIATIRSAVATLIAVAMVSSARVDFVVLRPASLWMRSLAGCSAMLCLFFAMTHYDIAVVLSLSSMYPIWVAILGWPMLGQTPSRDTWFALSISTAGMWLIYASATGPVSPLDEQAHYLPQLAIPLATLASMFSAVALIGLHRVKELDPRAVVTHFSAVSTLLSLTLWLWMPAQAVVGPTHNGSLVRLLAVGVAAVLGQLFLTKAFAAGRPARISVIGLSQVAFAAAYKWFFEGRIPSGLGCIGMLLVISATVWVMVRGSGTRDQPLGGSDPQSSQSARRLILSVRNSISRRS
jgi:drug/metabolite transporter (DMT)-like permease